MSDDRRARPMLSEVIFGNGTLVNVGLLVVGAAVTFVRLVGKGRV